ncbi:GGDEF domain-containing protein [Octadecabacter sp.]|nr:GGDEF domain-containing protein [Octadecabacter sp.]
MASKGKVDFLARLALSLLLCGVMNHLRHIIYTPTEATPFRTSLFEASFIAAPICILMLLLISHLFAVQKHLHRQANVDTLSQLTNRRWFMQNTPENLEDGHMLLFVDIDHFKRTNDRFGHDVGDICLQQMAIHLRVSLGYQHSVSRIGGEEFAALLMHTTDEEVAVIAKRISEGFTFDAKQGASMRITSSVGIARCHDGQTRTQAMRIADQAVYRAKQDGRACYVIADAPMSPNVTSYRDQIADAA